MKQARHSIDTNKGGGGLTQAFLPAYHRMWEIQTENMVAGDRLIAIYSGVIDIAKSLFSWDGQKSAS